jgi:hypothetical protein
VCSHRKSDFALFDVNAAKQNIRPMLSFISEVMKNLSDLRIITIYLLRGDRMISPIQNFSSNSSVAEKERNEKKEEGKEQKKQFVSQVEGKFYCTYLIDSKGNKVLINRLPVSQLGQLDASASNLSDFEKIKQEVCLQRGNNDLRLKQQTNIEAAHKVNVQDMMEILKSCVGIPNQIDCGRKLKK